MSVESPQRSKPKAASTTPVSMNGNESQTPGADTAAVTAAAAAAAAAAAKPKRVRTGCLTCRERHLKCDEGMPNCQNCKKSNRKCKRGIRLNFIDINCERPPYLLPATHDWRVSFQDDSREIASEYQGGLEKYSPLEPSPKRRRTTPPENTNYEYGQVAAPVMSHQQLPEQGYASYGQGADGGYAPTSATSYTDPGAAMAHQMSSYSHQSRPSFDQSALMLQEQADSPQYYLTDRDELLYMQVFVEEVGIWMDSMDAEKHFSELLPFQALRQPMLKHALLACAVRHLTLINPVYADEAAVNHYNMATQALLKSLQNPDRDTVLCATTATVLNVYEVMSEKALQRMNHIAGARALIKECRWDATTTGIGGACFWLNVGLEMFSCLHFNWGVAWDPDTWGIDMNMNPQTVGGNEEEWTHKMLWILAKITNFRSSVPRFQEQSVQAEQARMHQRHQQWLGLRQFCEKWDSCIPPTMHPMASIPAPSFSSHNSPKSSFPEVWYIKRATIVARLFYHTALTLLGSVHPMQDMDHRVAAESEQLRTYHSQQICGIVAHVKDRGVASASIRCLAIAAEYLTSRTQQEEVLDIFDKIKKETGWRVTFIHDDLREKWGWNTPNQNPTSAGGVNGSNGPSSFYQGGQPNLPNPQQSRPKPPSGIINPLYKNADFGGSNPPYAGNYVPPNLSHVMGAGTSLLHGSMHSNSHGHGHGHSHGHGSLSLHHSHGGSVSHGTHSGLTQAQAQMYGQYSDMASL